MTPAEIAQLVAYREKRRRYTRARQRRVQREGRCIQCGKGPLETKNHCAGCAEKQRVHVRNVRGSKPWQPGGPGRPPLYLNTKRRSAR